MRSERRKAVLIKDAMYVSNIKKRKDGARSGKTEFFEFIT